MTDRRRINGPSNGTSPPIYAPSLSRGARQPPPNTSVRNRKPNELRKIFLKTGLNPSASGSAYLELQRALPTKPNLSHSPSSTLKLTCTVHGPKPLPRFASFSLNLVISTYVKLAPFASRQRRGYIRDSRERDLSVHLETALKGVVLGERWPESGVDVVVTVLEGEEDDGEAGREGSGLGVGMMTVLAGCISVASAALADARIDCLDLVSGGVAAIIAFDEGGEEAVRQAGKQVEGSVSKKQQLVLDPCPADQGKILAVCVVGYMASCDEITELWVKGDLPSHVGVDGGQPASLERLISGAVTAARGARMVLVDAVRESAERLASELIPDGMVPSIPKEKHLDEDTKMEE